MRAAQNNTGRRSRLLQNGYQYFFQLGIQRSLDDRFLNIIFERVIINVGTFSALDKTVLPKSVLCSHGEWSGCSQRGQGRKALGSGSWSARGWSAGAAEPGRPSRRHGAAVASARACAAPTASGDHPLCPLPVYQGHREGRCAPRPRPAPQRPRPTCATPPLPVPETLSTCPSATRGRGSG